MRRLSASPGPVLQKWGTVVTMTIYLLRHAIAEERSAAGRDRDRKLTAEGIAKLETVLRVAARAGLEPRQIIASPYARTVQTASIARRALSVRNEVSLSDAFTPDAAPSAAWAEMRDWADDAPLLVVTHEPLVSSLLSFLLGVSEHVHDFRKAGLAMLELHRTGARPAATIRWLLTPALAAGIAHEAND
ncbi:MAG: histidine phosphatase family protein [Bryobacterales bacterium]|nr:histidine phosphatase family protein [Bryobacterales bacterium]